MLSGTAPKSSTPPHTAKRVQMIDIARLAGVSTATVSRALSGSDLIPHETRQRIVEIAQAKHYQVNLGAANLRRRDIQTVGVVVCLDSLQLFSDPFILSYIGHLADSLNQHGMNLLLMRIESSRMTQMATIVDSRQVAGLLVIGQHECHAYLNQLAQRGVHMAVWGAALPDAAYPVVGGDNVQGGYLATQHLLQKGCRSIAFLGDTEGPEVALRHQGYTQALREAGLVPDPTLHLPFLFSYTALRQTIGTWLDQGLQFDGIFASSDVAALTVISALIERGVNVPGQVRVVGYDDVAMSAHLHPSLTSVRQPTDLAASAMVQLLLESLAGNERRNVLLPAHLVQRESST
jgi:DNA-binding LacI/PurR family transcriptional regulator